MRPPLPILIVLAVAAPAAAGELTPAPRADEALAAPAMRYETGALHRLLFGDDYRALWALPVQLEVLDLERFGGGLEPVRRVGAGQSSGLALRGADGRAYTFRGLEKDAARGLPPDLQATIAGRIAQDQTAAMHPGATVVVGPLLEAAGVLHVEARLAVMPDDPRLGEFRADFANVLGTIQEFPRGAAPGRPGFAGATEILSGEELLARLRRPGEVADARAYLRARLVDLLVGDWDRHLGQWRWARLPGVAAWQPIPEDRDFAFCRFEGLVLAIARNWSPRWVRFGETYPDVLGLAWQSWPLDRRLLSGLERGEWEETASVLRARLDDGVLAAAVARLPDAYRRADGDRLERALRRRRDALPGAALALYRLLAEEVEVEGTDGPDLATAVALEGGGLELTVAPAGADGAAAGPPVYRRRLSPDETREVRLHLGGGADRFAARGRGLVRVHVLGGEGDDVLDDAAGGGAHLADWQGHDRLIRGRATVVDTRAWAPPPPLSRSPWMPARDWGRQVTYVPWFAASPELGAFAGAGVRHERFGFRTHPHTSRQLLRAGWATGAKGAKLEYRGDLRFEHRAPWLRLDARASQIELLRWYGLGNETRASGEDDFHDVRQERLSAAPSLHVPVLAGVEVWGGARLEQAWTEKPAGRLVSLARPYGSAPFAQAGVEGGLRLDTRDREEHPTRGVFLDVGGAWHPALWDVARPFGRVRAEAAGIVTAPWPLRPSLALRAGGERVFGAFPFHEAAFVGGPATLRGHVTQRFAGDASAYASAEVRSRLGRYFLVLPGDYGLFAFGDAGRVWLDGERSRRWHAGYGGGLWFAYVDPGNTVTVAVARADGDTGLYAHMGFLF